MWHDSSLGTAWPAHEHTCTLQGQPHRHLHPALLQRLQRSGAHPPVTFQNRSSAFCPCPHFMCPNIMASQVTTFHDGLLVNTCQAASMLPHFAYMSTKLFPTKTSDSKPLWMSCSWTSLLFASASKSPHALITWTNLNLPGLIPSCCICWKSCITFSYCPSFTFFVSFLFYAKMFNCTVPGAIAAISAATHGRFHQSSSHRSSPFLLCLKFWYLHWSTTRNPGQADQPCILHIPGIKMVSWQQIKPHWPSPLAREFCHSILHLLTFSSLLLLFHHSKGSENNFCQS